MKNNTNLVLGVVLAVLLLSAYSNTFMATLALDDFHSFAENPLVQIEEINPETISSLAHSQFGFARFIPMLSFALNYHWGHQSLVVAHATNLVIHLLATLAVFLLLSNLLTLTHGNQGISAARNTFVALGCVGLWAINPVQTNAVTYLVQRMASLVTLFYVLSVGFFILGRMGQTSQPSAVKGPPRGPFIASALFAFAAFLSKENSAMLPVMIAVTEVWFFDGAWGKWLYRRFMRMSVWLKLIVAGIGLALMVKAFLFLPGLLGGYGGRHFTLGERLLTESRIVPWYVGLFFLPLPSRLSLEHDVLLSRSLLDPWTTLIGCSLLIAAPFLIIRYRKKYPLLTYGVAWYLLNLVIESTVVPLELIFEHRLYLSSVGLIIALSGLLGNLVAKVSARLPEGETQRAGWALFCILWAMLSVACFIRNEAWQSRLAIYADAVGKAPEHPRAHANLASALVRAKQFEAGIAEGELAISKMQPGFEKYFVATAAILTGYLGLGRYEEAITRGAALIEGAPPGSDAASAPHVFLALAEAYRLSGDLAQAYSKAATAFDISMRLPDRYQKTGAVVMILTKILEDAGRLEIDIDGDNLADPGETPKLTWLAKRFEAWGDRATAVRMAQDSVRDFPDNQEARQLLNRLNDLETRNRLQAANWSFSQKYSLPKSLRSGFDLAMTLAYWSRKYAGPGHAISKHLGRWGLNRAAHVRPNSPDVLLLRGWYLLDDDSPAGALEAALDAVAADPGYAKAWAGIGFFAAAAGKWEMSLEAFQKTLELYPGCPRKDDYEGLLQDLRRRKEGDIPGREIDFSG